MALQITQQPGSVSFAGDPIIAKAKTTLSDKTFLRIVADCTVKVLRSGDEFQYSESYTYFVGSDGVATFNVANTVRAALDKYVEQEVNGVTVSQTLYTAQFQITYKEMYLDGVLEVTSSTVTSEWYKAVMGRLTEYERMTASNADTASLLGSGRILSRKPAGERVPKGIDLYLPAISTVSDTLSYYTQQTEKKAYSQYTGGTYVPASLKISTDALSEGVLTVGISQEAAGEKVVVPQIPVMKHFLFLNGFGLIESVTAITKESFSYTIQAETYTVPAEINYRGHTRTVSYADSPQAELEMSSGYVNREWAEWWLSEFVTTRKAWMLDGGIYLPVAIIPDEENIVYDRTKPGLLAVGFTVRYSFLGSAYNTFIK